MKSWIVRCVYFQLLCRVDPVSNHVAPWRGDLKSGGFRLELTTKVQPSKHLKLKPLGYPIFHKYSSRFRKKLEKNGGRVKITPLLYPLSRGQHATMLWHCNTGLLFYNSDGDICNFNCTMYDKISNETLKYELWKNRKCDVTWSLPPPLSQTVTLSQTPPGAWHTLWTAPLSCCMYTLISTGSSWASIASSCRSTISESMVRYNSEYNNYNITMKLFFQHKEIAKNFVSFETINREIYRGTWGTFCPVLSPYNKGRGSCPRCPRGAGVPAWVTRRPPDGQMYI